MHNILFWNLVKNNLIKIEEINLSLCGWISTIKFDLNILISVCDQPSGDIQRVQDVDADDPTQSVRHKVDGLYNSVQVKVRFSLSWEITFINKPLNNYFIMLSLFSSL
jgi:hypothetical protein